MAGQEASRELEFGNGTEDCLLARFKSQYITDDWYEVYTKQYEDRVQAAEETPLEYMEIKRYLLQRAGVDDKDRAEKQEDHEIMKAYFLKSVSSVNEN